jgi:hypothetical protein
MESAAGGGQIPFRRSLLLPRFAAPAANQQRRNELFRHNFGSLGPIPPPDKLPFRDDLREPAPCNPIAIMQGNSLSGLC